MLRVHRTDTDEIVLIHEPSQTVVVDDTFDAAMGRLRERLGDGFDAAVGPPSSERSPSQAPAPTPLARYALLGLLVALPFVWLGALHVSLGSLVVELRRDAIGAEREAEQQGDDEASLRADIDAIGRRVDRLVDDVSKLKREAKRKPVAAAELPAEDEDEDEGEDEGDEETAGDAPDEAETDAAVAPTERPGSKSTLGARKPRPPKSPPT